MQELYDYAWDTFYKNESQEQKMFKLFTKVMLREMEDGTYHPRNRQLANKSFGKEVIRNIKKINNMKVSPTYYDEIFPFNGQWDMPSSCGLKIRNINGKTYVIVTELYQDNPGTSVTYAGKSLAEQICKAKNLNINEIVYVECNPDTNSKLSFYDEEYFLVSFDGDIPTYHQLTPEEVLFLFPKE